MLPNHQNSVVNIGYSTCNILCMWKIIFFYEVIKNLKLLNYEEWSI